MTENEFIHIVPQLRQITLQISQGYGVGCDEAEDIAQDAMLKLWAIKDDIQSAAHAKGSMGCIAKHLCIDFFRKRKMISIDAQPFDKSPSHYAPPDVEVENSENELVAAKTPQGFALQPISGALSATGREEKL